VREREGHGGPEYRASTTSSGTQAFEVNYARSCAQARAHVTAPFRLTRAHARNARSTQLRAQVSGRRHPPTQWLRCNGPRNFFFFSVAHKNPSQRWPPSRAGFLWATKKNFRGHEKSESTAADGMRRASCTIRALDAPVGLGTVDAQSLTLPWELLKSSWNASVIASSSDAESHGALQFDGAAS
jgi:hypothetical protein